MTYLACNRERNVLNTPFTFEIIDEPIDSFQKSLNQYNAMYITTNILIQAGDKSNGTKKPLLLVNELRPRNRLEIIDSTLTSDLRKTSKVSKVTFVWDSKYRAHILFDCLAQGGANKALKKKYSKSTDKTLVQGRECCVYLGPRGGRYIRRKGEYVRIRS
jgi:hypothetical protein